MSSLHTQSVLPLHLFSPSFQVDQTENFPKTLNTADAFRGSSGKNALIDVSHQSMSAAACVYKDCYPLSGDFTLFLRPRNFLPAGQVIETLCARLLQMPQGDTVTCVGKKAQKAHDEEATSINGLHQPIERRSFHWMDNTSYVCPTWRVPSRNR